MTEDMAASSTRRVIARLELARDELLAVKPYGSISKLGAEMIAGMVIRSIAELRGEEPRYPALEAENAASAD